MKTNIKLNKTKVLTLAALTAQLCSFANDYRDEGYVAHEWGTFTSVQGADGVPQEWHPLITSELPSFVYDRSGSAGSGKKVSHFVAFTKEDCTALQRMETPVIYFYSDRERTVSAKVLFPKGQMTEWYPVATGPATDTAGGLEMLRLSHLRWDNVRVLPNQPYAKSATLPDDQKGSHYYAARATDANLVQVNAAKEGNSKVETEKFLFYRGVGWFAAPLRVSMASDEAYLELSNQGVEPLAHLFVVEMSQGKGRFKYVSKLAPKQTERVIFETAPCDGKSVTTELAAALRAALASEGLYPREAAAMVATWNESWFGEDGVRVLYLLPRAWTDQILPLELNPKPKELVRTMVGRAEMIKPSVERQLAEQIKRYGHATYGARQQAVTATRALGLGRFLEPAVRRAQQQSQSKEYQDLANQLLEAAGKPAKAAEKTDQTARVALAR